MSKRGWHQTQLDKLHESIATIAADHAALQGLTHPQTATVEVPEPQAPLTGG